MWNMNAKKENEKLAWKHVFLCSEVKMERIFRNVDEFIREEFWLVNRWTKKKSNTKQTASHSSAAVVQELLD